MQHPFDELHGVDSSGLIGGGNLAAGHTHDAYITGYVGVPPSRFLRTIERWRESGLAVSASAYTFVDLGCGKGRAVLLASAMEFIEVIGIELNPELAQRATKNLTRWTDARRLVSPARIVCVDATDFELPPGPCLVYLFNPFGAPVLRRLLERIEAHVAAGLGSVDVIYQNPEQAAVFTEFPSFVPLWSEAIAMSDEDAAVDPVCSQADLCRGYRR